MGAPRWLERSGGEAVAVRARRDPEPAREGASERLDRAEAAAAGDGLDRLGAGLEREARTLDAQRLDVGGGRHAGLGLERAGEVALAHARAAGERGDGEVVGEVVDHPRLQLAQRLARGALGGELSAELRLAPRALD